MALANSPVVTDETHNAHAEYPKNLTNSGYGGSASLANGPDDDEEYDEEELTITDDDEEDDEELTIDDDDDDV